MAWSDTDLEPEAPVRVLVADDDPEIRRLVRLVLEADDRFEVVGEAGSGEGAVDACADAQPDAVVLDLSMPSGGAEVIARLRDAAPGVRVVVFTGRVERVAGADAVVVKGESFGVLRDRLLGAGGGTT